MKNQKGITLIALVITIIVLLILAGVTIAMLTGENGILKKATGATDATGQAEANEAVQLALSTILANKNDPTYTGPEKTITFDNIASIIENDNSSAVVLNGNTLSDSNSSNTSGSSNTNIIIKYKASSTAKAYTVIVDSSKGTIIENK